MIDLERQMGLPIYLNGQSGLLTFDPKIDSVQPDVRRLSDLRAVLLDPAAPGPSELYYMYRDVALPGMGGLLKEHGLRYDITVIPPARVGREYAKTAGHYHPMVPGAAVTYPEVYEVVYGRAYYLIQKPAAASPGIIDDVAVFEVSAGQKVLIPPGYGHVTINLGSDVLVMTNLVENGFESIYEPYRQYRGAAYYCIEDDLNEPLFVENEHYKQVVDPIVRPAIDCAEAGLSMGIPLFQAAVSDPKQFRYLVKPQEYLDLMVLLTPDRTWDD